MSSVNFINCFIFLILVFLTEYSSGEEYGSLWCQQGEKKDFSPIQCPAQTLECFKFTCDGIEDSFVARGCGVSVLTSAAGLPNESCHQAQSICEYVGGRSLCDTCGNKHMCNSSDFPRVLYILAIVFMYCFL